jgi:hypothetical protein
MSYMSNANDTVIIWNSSLRGKIHGAVTILGNFLGKKGKIILFFKKQKENVNLQVKRDCVNISSIHTR